MNRQYKRAEKKLRSLFWCMTLILSFLLSGCVSKENELTRNTSEESSNNKVREADKYVQQEIELPQDILQTSYAIVGFFRVEDLELFLYNLLIIILSYSCLFPSGTSASVYPIPYTVRIEVLLFRVFKCLRKK